MYGVDREVYIEVLKTVELAVAEGETGEAPEAEARAPEAAETRESAIGPAEGPVTELVAEYKGNLAALRGGVEAFLRAESVDPTVVGADGKRLIDSLLATADQNMALDWKRREAMQAKLKIACKRVMVRFGYTADKGDAVADRFVSWLRVQVSDSEPTPRLTDVANP